MLEKAFMFVLYIFGFIALFGVINRYLSYVVTPANPMYFLIWIAIFLAGYFAFFHRKHEEHNEVKKKEKIN